MNERTRTNERERKNANERAITNERTSERARTNERERTHERTNLQRHTRDKRTGTRTPWPGSNWRPSARLAAVTATIPRVIGIAPEDLANDRFQMMARRADGTSVATSAGSAAPQRVWQMRLVAARRHRCARARPHRCVQDSPEKRNPALITDGPRALRRPSVRDAGRDRRGPKQRRFCRQSPRIPQRAPPPLPPSRAARRAGAT